MIIKAIAPDAERLQTATTLLEYSLAVLQSKAQPTDCGMLDLVAIIEAFLSDGA